MLIVMAGLPGTGKSTLAHRLADKLSVDGSRAMILNKDIVRAALFSPAEIEYSTRQDDLCVDVMLQAAEYVLRQDPCKHVVPCRHVILDGRSYSRRYQVDVVRAFARQQGVPCALIECVCSDEEVRRRLERDVSQARHPTRSGALSAAWTIYLAADALAPVLEVDRRPRDGKELLRPASTEAGRSLFSID